MRRSTQYLLFGSKKPVKSEDKTTKPVAKKRKDRRRLEGDTPGFNSPGETYNYRKLLTANLNLVNVVDSGEGLYFDCPPLNYNQLIDVKSTQEELAYYVVEDPRDYDENFERFR